MIYVVGCNHGIQPRREDWLGGDTAQAREQKLHFAGLIEEIIRDCGIQSVGEEWGREEITTAHALADNYGLRWANINTSPEDLDRLGIPRDYVEGIYPNEQEEQWHRQREQFMHQKIREHQGAAENLLIVCGFEHLRPLCDLLGQNGAAVEPIDYRERAWYQDGVFSDP